MSGDAILCRLFQFMETTWQSGLCLSGTPLWVYLLLLKSALVIKNHPHLQFLGLGWTTLLMYGVC